MLSALAARRPAVTSFSCRSENQRPYGPSGSQEIEAVAGRTIPTRVGKTMIVGNAGNSFRGAVGADGANVTADGIKLENF